MAEPFNFELILTDFLKYMPDAKRSDYELMLRRCNFSDPADPMFPVMLFLLFFQDNLADRMDGLTEEIQDLKLIPPTENVGVSESRGKSCWNIVITILLAIQLFLTVFVVFFLTMRDFPVYPKNSAAISYSNEIQNINRYWDIKLQQAEREFHMNRLDLIPEAEILEGVFLFLVIFVLLALLQIICFIQTLRGLRKNEKILEKASERLHRDCLHRQKTEEIISFFNDSTQENTASPDILTPEPPPIADATAWEQVDKEVQPSSDEHAGDVPNGKSV